MGWTGFPREEIAANNTTVLHAAASCASHARARLMARVGYVGEYARRARPGWTNESRPFMDGPGNG